MPEASTAPFSPEQDAFLRARIRALCDASWGNHAALTQALNLTKHRFHYLLRRPGRLRLKHVAVIAKFYGFTVEILLSTAPLPPRPAAAPSPRQARAQIRARLRELSDDQVVALYADMMTLLSRSAPAADPATEGGVSPRDVFAAWGGAGRVPTGGVPLAPLL